MGIISGYSKQDPLDYLNKFWRYGLPIIVSIILSLLLLITIDGIHKIVFFKNDFTKVLEVIMFIITTATFVYLRKSGYLFFYLFILIPLLIIDLWLESHCPRTLEDRALWNYYPESFIHDFTEFTVVKYLITLSVDALLMGPILMVISRFIAKFFVEMPKENITLKNYQPLDTECSPKRDLGFWIIRMLGLGFLCYLFILLLGSMGTESLSLGKSMYPRPFDNLLKDTYANFFHGVNTFGKIGLLAILAFAAAFNRPMRFYFSVPLVTGHLVAALFSLIFYLLYPDHLDSNPAIPDYEAYITRKNFLWDSFRIDCAVLIIFIIVMLHSYSYRNPLYTRVKLLPSNYSLTSWIQDKIYLVISLVCGLIFLGLVFCYIVEWNETGNAISNYFAQPEPLLVNSLTLYSTLAVIAFMATRYKQIRDKLAYYVHDPLLICAAASLIWFIVAYWSGSQVLENSIAKKTAVIMFLSGILCLMAIKFVRNFHYSTHYKLNSLHPSEADVAVSFINGLFNRSLEFDYSIVKTIDEYVGNIKSRKRGLINFPFWIVGNLMGPILALRPRMTSMSPEESTFFLSRYLMRKPEDANKAFIPLVANFSSKLGESLKALSCLAFFSSDEGKKYVSYVDPTNRERLKNILDPGSPNGLASPLPDGPQSTSYYLPDQDIDKDKLVGPNVGNSPIKERKLKANYDYIIVGSGAAGAVMAYRLACKVDDSSKILLIERGSRLSHENDMTDHEMQMAARLFKEGGLQQTKNFDMVVLQGEALGGTTVSNNAVCFQIPDNAEKEWSDYGLDSILNDLKGPDGHYQKIKDEIKIGKIDKNNAVNPKVYDRFVDGTTKQGMVADLVEVNAHKEIGDGLWNLGNKRRRKTSMENTYIPWAEAKGIHVSCNTNALKFISDPSSDLAYGVMIEKNGTIIEVGVNKKLIIACGCIASSHLIMRSDETLFKNPRIACNYAFPIAFKYNETLNAYDGAQITASAKDPAHPEILYETYFNPPGAFSLTLPFNFTTFRSILKDYTQYLNFGILIKSKKSGKIQKKADALYGRAFNWNLEDSEIKDIKRGFIQLLKIAQSSGAVEAILPLRPGIRLDLTDLTHLNNFIQDFENYPLKQEEIVLSTAHPQSGNPMMGSDVIEEIEEDWIVDTNFKLRNYSNVHVVDASVFPCSIGVNPQWTIMALSSLASESVLSD